MSTYEDGYKRGVEAALDEIKGKFNIPWNHLSPLFDAVRKSLLTKKVTKWIRVVYDPYNTPSLYPGSFLQDTKEAAIGTGSNHGLTVSAFPLEIEVPL
jgi:hypothetical protein